MKIKNFLLGVVLSSLFCGFTVGVVSTNVQGVIGDDTKTFFEEDYKTTKIANSKAYSHNHVGGDANATHGLVPGAWGGTVNAGDGYLIYQINAADGKVFETVKFVFNATLRNDMNMNDGTKAVGSIKIYASLTPDTFTNPLSTYTALGDKAALDYENDLTSIFSGYSTGYVKLETFHTAGNCVLNNLGLHLYSVKATGTEKDSDFVTVEKVDNFTASGERHYDSLTGAYCSGSSHGIVPSSTWGGSITIAADSYVIYSLSTNGGASFKQLSIDLSVRIWDESNEEPHAKKTKDSVNTDFTIKDCSVDLFISDNLENFGDPVKTFEAVKVCDDSLNRSYMDFTKCLNLEKVYVKIKLNHPVCYVGLAHVGVKLYSANIKGFYSAGDAVETEDFKKTILLSQEYNNYKITGSLKSGTISGADYVFLAGDFKASLTIPVELPLNRDFFNLNFSQKIRCTTYNGTVIEKALTYSISYNNVTFVKLYSLDTDANWARKTTQFDLPATVRNKNVIYIMISFDWGTSTSSRDWIAVGDITLEGSVIKLGDKKTVTNYIDRYMHMSETTSKGYCSDSTHHYYSTAKEALLQLTQNQRKLLATDTSFADAYARLQAWAVANGEVINIESGELADANTSNLVNSNNLLLIVLPVIAVVSIASFILIKKRKAE